MIFIEKRIQALMKLGATREEAIATLQDDCDIDHNKPKDFDLSKEQLKVAQQYTRTGTRKTTNYNFSKRERKENPTKILIVDELFSFLKDNEKIQAEDTEVTNKSRQISFKCNGNAYELTLIEKRKPKEDAS